MRTSLLVGPRLRSARSQDSCAVKIAVGRLDDKPLRASGQKEPGMVRPDCRACQRDLLAQLRGRRK